MKLAVVENGNEASCGGEWRAGMKLAVVENGNEASCGGEWEASCGGERE